MSVRLGYDHIEDPPEIAAALRAPAELASSLGVTVKRMLVKTPRPVTALLEVIADIVRGCWSSAPIRITERPVLSPGQECRAGSRECLVWHAGAIEETQRQ